MISMLAKRKTERHIRKAASGILVPLSQECRDDLSCWVNSTTSLLFPSVSFFHRLINEAIRCSHAGVESRVFKSKKNSFVHLYSGGL